MKSWIKTIFTVLFYVAIIFSVMAIKGAMSHNRHERSLHHAPTSYSTPKVKQDVPPLKVEDLPSRRGNNDTGS